MTPNRSPRFVSRLTQRHAGAGPRRRTWFAPQAAHPLARQARGALRGQVPHHRFPAVQLRQLRHPQGRHAHAVQIPFADPAHAARLGVHARRNWASSSRCCRRSNAWRPPGTRALRTPCYRTSTSSDRQAPDFVLILAGDHVYKMDYGTMLAAHAESGADMTVGCIEVPLQEASAFGVMAVDAHWRITEFAEKPEHPQPVPGNPGTRAGLHGHLHFPTRTCCSTSSLRDRHDRGIHARFRPRHHSLAHPALRRVRLSVSATRRPAPRPTGATWARWMPSGRRTWN